MDEIAPVEIEVLPPLYQKWATSLLPGPIPRERVATCADCAMCVPKEEQHDGVGYYQRSLKCCTYFPKLPNYLVGRALEGDNPGAARLRGFIAGESSAGKANPLGASLFEVQKSLGHSTSVMTQRYAHLADSGLRDRADQTAQRLTGTDG